MRTSLRRTATIGAAGVLLVGVGLAASWGDGLSGEGDAVVAGVPTLQFGELCPGATATRSFDWELVRSGGGNSQQVWANGAVVTIAPPSATTTAAGTTIALASRSATLPSGWVAQSNGTTFSAGASAVTVTVPDGAAPIGPQTVNLTYTASGAGSSTPTVTRSAPVAVSVGVADCDVDDTPPSIDYTLDPAAPTGAHGWYAGDVALDWTVADPDSAATTTGCDDAAVTADGTTSYSCAASSEGGSAGPVMVTLQRDATPPTVVPTVSGDLGDEGWYVGDVDVHWAVADATSGVDSAVGCDDGVLSDDTAGQTFTCTVTDVAGNVTAVSTSVRRDATKPVITRTVAGAVGGNGWYTGDVQVDWQVSDATSDLASTTGCASTTVDADTTGLTLSCAAADHAGNTASDEVTIRRDATAPAITWTATGPQGQNGWYVGPVDVAWQVTDDGSGLATTFGCDPTTLAADTAGTDLTCSATDAAGNPAASTVGLRVDATPPVVTPTVSGPLGANGWYVGDTTVSWSTGDATSGVVSTVGCDPTVVSADTLGDLFTCTATDDAGNSASGQATVRRDATPPAVTFTSGPADGASYDFGDAVPVAVCSASDPTSGVTAAGCVVNGGDTSVGSHTLTASATDEAGNVGVTTRGYTIRPWALDGFLKPVNMGSSVVNTVKAGSTVPLKFTVLRGGVPMTSGIGAVFSAKKVACDGSAIPDAVEEFSTTGQTSLRYDATAGQWIQNWATPSGGKGSCYRVSLTTADGSSTAAAFQLK